MQQYLTNAQTINLELDWFQRLIQLRLKITFEQSETEQAIQKLQPPSIENDSLIANEIDNFIKTLERPKL